jgi:glutathione S-transferase
MKLYFSPGACSLSPHIVLREAGLPFELEKVDLKTKKTKSGVDFVTVSPKGAVPTLQLDDGQILTEGAAIVQYLADKKPGSNLAPANGTLERYRLQEWLNYIATEMHKSFSPLFKPTTPDEFKATIKEQLRGKVGYLQQQLEGKQYLMGDQFTVADAYLFTILQWAKGVGIDLAQWPAVQQYTDRIRARPAVKEALEAEKAARAAG